MIMRLTPLIWTALVLSISGPLFAQEWIEFASREDRFTCNFPTQPTVTQTTYVSQHEAERPARIHSATQGQSRYSVTVVDYTQAQRILTEKAKSCPAGAEPCLGGPGDEGHWKSDIRGAMDYAAWQLMKRDAKLTLFVWSNVDQVEGHQLQLTNNADKSRTFVGIYMHENSGCGQRSTYGRAAFMGLCRAQRCQRRAANVGPGGNRPRRTSKSRSDSRHGQTRRHD